MSRLESMDFPLSKEETVETDFTIRPTDTAAGPQRPFELRRESLEAFDREIDHAKEIPSTPKSSEVLQALANAERLFREKEYKIAEGLYRAVLRLNSDDETAIRGLAQCLHSQNRYEEASKVLRQLARQYNSAENFFLLAEELYACNYNEEALEAYFNALRFNLEDSAMLFQSFKNVGNLLLRLGDPNGAEEYYSKAFTINPDSDVLAVNFGSLALFQGDYDRALNDFRRAVGLNDSNDKAWVGLSMIHREYGDSELAWANVEKALDINPGNDSAIKLVVDWAMKDNEIDKAITRIEAFMDIFPHDAYMAMMLSKHLFFAGYLNDALIEIEKALELDPQLDGAKEIRDVICLDLRNREVSEKR